jgi:hypothetical protein
MRQHPHSKQSPVGAFRVHDGTIVAGRDHLANGWYQVFPAGFVRGPVQSEPDVPPARRPARRRIRTPAIRAKRTILTLYGQIG